MKRRYVSEQEHAAFIAAYPRKLETHALTIVEPPMIAWNDFSLGDYPESIVASKVMDEPPSYSILAEPMLEYPAPITNFPEIPEL